MNHKEAPPMANYPSPPAPGHNGFYNASSVQPRAEEQEQPDAEGLQLAAQLSGSLAEPMLRENEPDPQMGAAQIDPSQNNQYEEGQQAQQQYEGQQAQQYEGQQAPQYEDQQAQQLGLRQGQEGMNLAQNQAYGNPGTPTEIKKRSKVSRACDECRRKKIRCDAFSEQETCSNCKRVGARCQFSRVPQKRGPSKGYIKELSDRVNNLEASARNSLHPGEAPFAPMNPDGASPRGYEEFSPGPNGARKRNHSAISNDFGGASPYQQGYRQSQDWQRTGYPSGQPVETGYPAYASDNMAPQPVWRNPPEGAAPVGTSAEAPSQNGHSQAGRQLDWESVLPRYYESIHSVLPVLASGPEKFLERLARSACPPNVADALFEAVQSVNNVLLPDDGSPKVEFGNRAVHDETIKKPFEAPGSRNFATQLLYLQAMIFRIIEADNLGPSHIFETSFWLSLAVGCAHTMALHKYTLSLNPAEFDPESNDSVGRRVWWSLVILDRMHAISNATPTMIPDPSVVPAGRDRILLGETTYQLARLSIVEGHVARLCLLPREPGSNFPAAIFSEILNGEMERCRESIEISDYSMYPVLFLQILHLRLLIKRIDPALEPLELLMPAVQMADMIRNSNSITPFSHHYAAVAAFTLTELRDIGKIPGDHEGIQGIIGSTAGRSAKNEGKDWYSAIMNLIMSGPLAAIPGANLHHLADLATADRTENSNAALDLETQVQNSAAEGETEAKKKEDTIVLPPPGIWDPIALMRRGYLTLLSNEFLTKQ